MQTKMLYYAVHMSKVAISAFLAWEIFERAVFAPLRDGYVCYCNSKSHLCDYEYSPSMDFFTILGFQGMFALVSLLILTAFCLWGTKWQKYSSLLWFGFVGIILIFIAYVLVLLGVAVYNQLAM